MKTPKTTTKPTRAAAAAKATPAKKKTSAASNVAPTTATAKKPAAATSKKSPAAASAKKTPLTSPRITAAASKAKGALTEPKRAPKVATKIAPPTAAPKSRPSAAPVAPIKETALPTAAKPAVTLTTIEAFIDVGFGNRLTLRGEGPGLSWEKGITMNCLGNAEWVISIENAVGPLTFKFLLNDELWSHGENYTLAPGKTGAFTPYFG